MLDKRQRDVVETTRLERIALWSSYGDDEHPLIASSLELHRESTPEYLANSIGPYIDALENAGISYTPPEAERASVQ